MWVGGSRRLVTNLVVLFPLLCGLFLFLDIVGIEANDVVPFFDLLFSLGSSKKRDGDGMESDTLRQETSDIREDSKRKRYMNGNDI